MVQPSHVPLVIEAYRRMAGAGYRPGAPSDGYGNITDPTGDLAAEAEAYAIRHLEEEETLSFHIGCADYSTVMALPLVIEAARLLCAPDPAHARRLLQLAIAALDEIPGR